MLKCGEWTGERTAVGFTEMAGGTEVRSSLARNDPGGSRSALEMRHHC